MLNQSVIIQRLSLIKLLYKIGIEQSNQSENIAPFSLLAFHDSIEMFLKLLSEKLEINSSKFNFHEYWDKIPSLTLVESMRSLNSRRVNLKHKGLLPSKLDIEISRVNTTDFFEQNTKTHFNIEFKDVSVTELIVFSTVKEYLELSQKQLDESHYKKCIESVAYAFDELLHVYENNKKGQHYYHYKSPFLFGTKPNIWSSDFETISKIDRKLGEHLRNLFSSVEALQDSMKIVSLGIDYRKFAKFKILTPKIRRYNESKKVLEVNGERKWDKNNCQFCIDFVIEAALKLQEFDFDLGNLIDTEPLDLEYVSGDLEGDTEFRKVKKGE